MQRWLGPLALLMVIGACATYPKMSEEELGFQQSCDSGDWAACADLAHSVAVDRPDTLAWSGKSSSGAPGVPAQ